MGKGNQSCSAMVEAVSDSRLSLAREACDLRRRTEAGDDSLRSQLAEAEDRLDGRAYLLPSEEMPKLLVELNKAVRRAERLGAMPPMFQIVEETMVDMTSSSSKVTAARKVDLVILVGGEVSPADGWRLLGAIEHLSKDKASVSRLPGAEGFDFERFSSSPPVCEHCNLKRARKKSFIVEGPDKELRQVGSACLEDYTGGATAEQAARYAESLLDLAKILSDSEKRGQAGQQNAADTGFFDPEQYLAWVVRQADKEGFVSRRKAYHEGSSSSADSARSELLGALQGSNPALPDAAQQQSGKDIVAWARKRFAVDRFTLSDYERNTAEALDEPLASYRSLPLLAGLYPAYQRHLAAASSPSVHVGQIGERIESEVKVNKVSQRETDYGMQRIYQLEDDKGNLMTWFSTSSHVMEEGEKYSLRGTVKRHEQYEGLNRTILTRCSVS